MVWKLSSTYGLSVLGIAVLGGGLVAWRFAFFFAPFSWTGEPLRLARALAIRPGMLIADIGAGSGAHAVAMAHFVGAAGLVYATELTPDKRAAIQKRAIQTPDANVHVIAGEPARTGLPEQCCDAIYLRAVFHHIAPRAAFAGDLARAVRPGGRVAVIDFAPGTLWFHGADHGVQPSVVLDIFQAQGLRLRERDEKWGGGMFLLVFERPARETRPERR